MAKGIPYHKAKIALAKPNPDQIQTVILTLDDGSRHAFTGKVAATKSDSGKYIVDITFTEPRDLPPNCSWEEIESKGQP